MRAVPFAILLLAFNTCFTRADEPTHDLIVRGGKIVDGTGNPWFAGDVGIRGGRIVALGKVDGTAKRIIDAKGRIVAPGFVDIHSHSDYSILEDGLAQSKIRQGVTTEVFGEGDSAGPRVGKSADQRWKSLGDYFNAVEKSGASPNVASFVGLSTVWKCVMGDSHARPTPAQMEEMKQIIADAMRDGAAGVSALLAQVPGSLATTDDLVELCKVAARHGGIFVVHIRHEGTEVFKAIDEVIEIGRRAGIQVEILHVKIADQRLWGKMNQIVERIEKARSEGVNIQANVYPYTRGHNNLSSIIPPWAHEGGAAKMLERLGDPKLRDRLKTEIRDGIPGWYNHYTAVGGDWSRMLLTGNTSFAGLTMDRVLANRGKDAKADPLDLFIDFLAAEGGSVPTIFEHHSEKDMTFAMRQPWVGIGSDGSALATTGPLRRGSPHPRSFGTFPRVLGLYVRETGLLKMEDAIRRMTSLNAAKIGATDRGTLRVGAAADLVVFDADRVIDRSTYEQPFNYSEGIEFVIVNGVLVLDKGEHTGAKPGKALRRSSSTSAETSIRAVLDAQVAAWNKGDLEGFMIGYWNSPELTFLSGNAKTQGWQATLDRYRKKYQGEKKEMGQLAFSELAIDSLSPDHALVKGRWKLTLAAESPTGLFTLIVRRLPEGWRITHDHTSN